MKSLMLFAVAAFAFSGCVFHGHYVHHHHTGPGYYVGDADFYYVRGRPYSRRYGALIIRNGRHYYWHGGRYVLYRRDTVIVRDRGPFYRGRTVYRVY